jgi:hypothetical protein
MNSWVKRLGEEDPQVHDNYQLSSSNNLSIHNSHGSHTYFTLIYILIYKFTITRYSTENFG